MYRARYRQEKRWPQSQSESLSESFTIGKSSVSSPPLSRTRIYLQSPRPPAPPSAPAPGGGGVVALQPAVPQHKLPPPRLASVVHASPPKGRDTRDVTCWELETRNTGNVTC